LSFYSDIAATALAVLQEFGAPGVLVKRAAGTHNAATGRVTQTPTRYDITLVVGKDFETSSAAVVKRRQEMIIGITPGVPTIDNEDVIVFGGRNYKVVDPGLVSPAGEPVVYVAKVES
jgi:hypothetical protein